MLFLFFINFREIKFVIKFLFYPVFFIMNGSYDEMQQIKLLYGKVLILNCDNIPQFFCTQNFVVTHTKVLHIFPMPYTYHIYFFTTFVVMQEYYFD